MHRALAALATNAYNSKVNKTGPLPWVQMPVYGIQYPHLQQRTIDVIDHIYETLSGMLEPCLIPSPDMRAIRSSASTPSLRSRDGTLPPHMRMDPGGNVRVVVRVRAFLPRGMISPYQIVLN